MQTTTVLIVEDEALIAEELRERLEAIGHTVVGVASSAEEAIVTARKTAPGLILMDVRLKGEDDGIDAAMMIGERSPAPVIFMTAHSDVDTVERAMLTRPFGYLVKPVREADLFTSVQTALLRRAAEERMQASERQSRRIVENATDIVLQLLPDGRLVSANPCGLKRLGYSRLELNRLSFLDLVAEGDREEAAAAVCHATQDDYEIHLTIHLLTRARTTVGARGVVGRRLVGEKVDRLWVVLHPTEAQVPVGAV